MTDVFALMKIYFLIMKGKGVFGTKSSSIYFSFISLNTQNICLLINEVIGLTYIHLLFFLQMGFEIPLSNKTVKVYLRQNKTIVHLKLELKQTKKI